MLPSSIRYAKRTWDTLRLLQQRTGLRPNVLSRYAFVRSLQSDYDARRATVNTMGAHELPISTAFGDQQFAYHLLIISRYGGLTKGDAGRVIANHIADGVSQLRGIEDLLDFLQIVQGRS
jgi:DNA sulfur modification protein DndE